MNLEFGKHGLETNLEFGKHGLETFGNPLFSHLLLKTSPLEKRSHWLVEHAGKTIVVQKERMVPPIVNIRGFLRLHDPSEPRLMSLIQVLKDPARKENLLALRKTNASTPFGRYDLFTVTKTGDEMPIGAFSFYTLNSKDGKPLGYVDSLGIIPFSLRKPASKHDELTRAHKLSRKLYLEESDSHSKINTDEEQTKLNKIVNAISDQLLYDPVKAVKPSGKRVYSNRGHKLSLLFFSLSEELARKRGFPAVGSHLSPDTTQKYMPKYGWAEKECPDKNTAAHHSRGKYFEKEV